MCCQGELKVPEFVKTYKKGLEILTEVEDVRI